MVAEVAGGQLILYFKFVFSKARKIQAPEAAPQVHYS